MFHPDTLKMIQETAQVAQQATVLESLNTDGRTAFVQQGAEIKQFALQPAPRDHFVHSLDDLIRYAREQKNAAPIVWHGHCNVVLLPDDADRRDSIMFPLTHSNRFAKLMTLAAEKPAFDQTKFVRLLRIELGLDNLKVVAKFRKLDFTIGNEGRGEVAHGNDRLGKTITAKVQSVEELPDQLDVEVPIYQQTGERQEYVVRCAIEIDTINQLFQLVPLPDELERVLDLAQASIHDRLTAGLKAGDGDGQAAVPIYYGKP